MKYYRLKSHAFDRSNDYFKIVCQDNSMLYVFKVGDRWSKPARSLPLPYSQQELITQVEAVLRGLDEVL